MSDLSITGYCKSDGQAGSRPTDLLLRWNDTLQLLCAISGRSLQLICFAVPSELRAAWRFGIAPRPKHGSSKSILDTTRPRWLEWCVNNTAEQLEHCSYPSESKCVAL